MICTITLRGRLLRSTGEQQIGRIGEQLKKRQEGYFVRHKRDRVSPRPCHHEPIELSPKQPGPVVPAGIPRLIGLDATCPFPLGSHFWAQRHLPLAATPQKSTLILPNPWALAVRSIKLHVPQDLQHPEYGAEIPVPGPRFGQLWRSSLVRVASAPACSWSPAASLLVLSSLHRPPLLVRGEPTLQPSSWQEWLLPQCAASLSLPGSPTSQVTSPQQAHLRSPAPSHPPKPLGKCLISLFTPIQPKAAPKESTGHLESLRCDLLSAVHCTAPPVPSSPFPPSRPPAYRHSFFPSPVSRSATSFEGKGIRCIRPRQPCSFGRPFLVSAGCPVAQKQTVRARRLRPFLSPSPPRPQDLRHVGPQVVDCPPGPHRTTRLRDKQLRSKLVLQIF